MDSILREEKMIDNNLKLAIDLLKSNNYLVIEKYNKPEQYNVDEYCKKFVGAFIDLETTGLDTEIDKIIEVGLVTFEFSSDGRIFKILDVFNQYQDPGIPIPERIIEITKITNDMVAGHNINKDKLIKYIAEADLIVAHNAGFDRGFLENFIPSIPQKPWACSMAEIDWDNEGIESAKLEFIAYKLGFHFDGHRAVSDCLAGIHILSKSLLKSNKQVLEVLLENCRKEKFKIWANGAPFDYKDILRQRGYKWNPKARSGTYMAWWIELEKDKVVEELKFLQAEIYKSKFRVPMEIVSAYTRYSNLNSTISIQRKNDNEKMINSMYNLAESD